MKLNIIVISQGGHDITKIRKDLILYTIIAAAAVEIISLPVLGPNILFPYGLAIGACAAIISLYIISRTIEQAAESRRRSPVIFGFIIRVLLYGGALYLAVSTSPVSLAGAAIGLLLPHISLYIMYGLVPAVRRKRQGRTAPEARWIPDTRSRLFIKDPWLVRYQRGRAFVTYRHYRKLRVAGPADDNDRSIKSTVPVIGGTGTLKDENGGG